MVNKELEEKRNEKVFGKSLEASVLLEVDSKTLSLLQSVEKELKPAFIISDLQLKEGSEAIKATAYKYDGEKCVRCWKLFPEPEIKEGICTDCTKAIKEFGS